MLGYQNVLIEHHDIAEILLKLALNTDQLINQSITVLIDTQLENTVNSKTC